MNQTILILGCGVGGLVVANKVRSALPKQHRVIVLDREPSFVFSPSLLWVMTGARAPEKISQPLDLLKKQGIEVVRGEIARLDPEKREATCDGRVFSGDFMVIALGADLAPEVVPGLMEAGHNFCNLAGATAFRDALAAFHGGTVALLTAAPAYKCPAAPYEAAMLVEYDLRKRKLREQSDIHLWAAEPGPMGVAGPTVSAAVRSMVEAKGVHYHPEHQVVSVNHQERKIIFSNGVEARYDLLAYVPPHRAPAVIREAGLTGASGWMEVDRSTLATAWPHVFAIGDVAGIPLKMGKPLPKAGVFAHRQAEVVAHNILRTITGKGNLATFDGYGECFVETGDGKAGFGKGNFYAEPVPQVALKQPTRYWHAGKVLLEKTWFRQWF